MRRTLVGAIPVLMAVVIAGCWIGWIGTPRALAENPVCTKTWCSFLTPSHNLSCEINFQRGSEMPDETYCQTDSPPQSVHMSTDGSFKPCTGETCIGNAGQGTPTLAYGQTAVLGPFSCRSEASGVTCTVPSRRGFIISNAGITGAGW